VAGGERGEQGEFASERAGSDDLGERVGVGSGRIATSGIAEHVEAGGLRRERRAAADGADFQGCDGDRGVQAVPAGVDGRDGVAPLDDLGGVLARREERGGDDVCGVGVESQRAGLGRPNEILPGVGLGDGVRRGAEPFLDVFVGIRTSAATVRPRPSTALIAAGFLSEQRLPERATRSAGVSLSTTSQAASVAMVTMFIPIASFVS